MSEEKKAPAKKDPRFKPGQSGNPKGRPKGSKNRSTLISEAIQGKLTRDLEKDASDILQTTIQKAKEGDTTCIKILMDRLMPAMRAGDGKKGAGPGDIVINVQPLGGGQTTIDGEVIDHEDDPS